MVEENKAGFIDTGEDHHTQIGPESLDCKLGIINAFIGCTKDIDQLLGEKLYQDQCHGTYGCFRNQQLGEQFFDTIFLIRTYIEAHNWNTAGSHKQYYDKADVSEYFR